MSSFWDELLSDSVALVAGEPDLIANMANLSALLSLRLNAHFSDQINWCGFYRAVEGSPVLILGPFQGHTACIRIPFGRGVCGTAAQTQRIQCVDDVDAFPGHISCDTESKSEIVVPLVHQGKLLGVLDIDSSRLACFDATSVASIDKIMSKCVEAWAEAQGKALSTSEIRHAGFATRGGVHH